MPQSPESSSSCSEATSEWSQREERADRAWIEFYSEIFADVARTQFALWGRGLVVVDTKEVLEEGGHPLYYLPQAEIEQLDEPVVQRIVRTYKPETQMVIIILKGAYTNSLYTISMPPLYPNLT